MNNPLKKKILFLRVKGQDKEAYGQFYDLYVSRIYRFIFFKINSVSDAQDLTSEVFLKLWQYLREGREITNLNSFTYMIARNSVVDFYRSKNHKIHESIETEELAQVADEKSDLMSQQIQGGQIDEVLKGLSGLKDEYKEVVVLRFLDELSIGEIAEVLGKNKGAVRVLIHRALKALKENIK